MKVILTYEPMKADAERGFLVTTKKSYCSWDKSEIEDVENWCRESIGACVALEVPRSKKMRCLDVELMKDEEGKWISKKKNDISPCPWCGEKPIEYTTQFGGHYLECENYACPVQPQSQVFRTREKLIEHWNERKK